MGHGCRICQSVAVGTAVGVAVGSGSSHPAVVSVRRATSPLIIPRVAPQFSVSTRILHGRRLLLVAIHKEHTAGPDYLDHPYQVGSTIHTILSFDPGAPTQLLRTQAKIVISPTTSPLGADRSAPAAAHHRYIVRPGTPGRV